MGQGARRGGPGEGEGARAEGGIKPATEGEPRPLCIAFLFVAGAGLVPSIPTAGETTNCPPAVLQLSSSPPEANPGGWYAFFGVFWGFWFGVFLGFLFGVCVGLVGTLTPSSGKKDQLSSSLRTVLQPPDLIYNVAGLLAPAVAFICFWGCDTLLTVQLVPFPPPGFPPFFLLFPPGGGLLARDVAFIKGELGTCKCENIGDHPDMPYHALTADQPADDVSSFNFWNLI